MRSLRAMAAGPPNWCPVTSSGFIERSDSARNPQGDTKTEAGPIITLMFPEMRRGVGRCGVTALGSSHEHQVLPAKGPCRIRPTRLFLGDRPGRRQSSVPGRLHTDVPAHRPARDVHTDLQPFRWWPALGAGV